MEHRDPDRAEHAVEAQPLPATAPGSLRDLPIGELPTRSSLELFSQLSVGQDASSPWLLQAPVALAVVCLDFGSVV